LTTCGAGPQGKETTPAGGYIYGPGYVDEFVVATTPAPTDPVGVSQYILQDANYNVVAQADLAGNIVFQNTWSPYGELLAFEQIAPIPPPGTQNSARLPIGHQGLFHVPFNLSTGTAPPVTSPAAGTDNGLYYNRNRWYSPTTGRFTQRDPNGVGLPILTVAAMNAEALSLLTGTLSSSNLYVDGPNLYQFVNSNPITHRDSLGLYDEFDDAIADLQGHRIATIAFLNDASGWALVGMHTTLDIMGGLMGVDVARAAMNIGRTGGDVWDWVEVGLSLSSGVLAHKAIKWGRKLYKSSKANRRFKAVTAAGRAYEKLVLGTHGWPRNTTKRRYNGVNAIPDAIIGNEVIEIKDVKRISFTRQLRTIAGWARENGKKAVLVEPIPKPV